MNSCVFCHLHLGPNQNIIIDNEHCLFLQLTDAQQKGIPLAGAGVIVPKRHAETVFDLTQDEWQSTYALLHEAKKFLDDTYQPDGYNVGWNSGEIAGQHILHAHLHVLPRYADETLAYKGIRYMFKNQSNSRVTEKY